MKDYYNSFLKPFSIFMASLLMFSLAILITQSKANAAGEFITTWKTDYGNPLDSSVTIPVHSGSTYNYRVDWGDGAVNENVTGEITHDYATPGTYTVSISGEFPRFYMNNHSEAYKLQTIEEWGSILWTSMRDAFEGASALVVNAPDKPDLSNVSDMSGMFARATLFNTDINDWDVSGVTDFSYMFRGNMFFDQPLNNWDVSSALNMEGMFRETNSFDQPLNNWDVSNVTNMIYMFTEAFSFNQDLSSWRLPNVVSIEYMFYNARDFNYDISQWDIDSLQRATHVLTSTSFSTENYEALLSGWRQDNVQSDVTLTGIPATYCNSKNDRDYLVNQMGWEISDMGAEPEICAPTNINFENSSGLFVEEFQKVGTVIGVLTTEDPNQGETFEYSTNCSGNYTDNQFFTINGNELLNGQIFNFSQPTDENRDNIYQICIVSSDSTGFFVEKEFTIEVTDTEEVVVTGGAVLGTSTTGTNSNNVVNESQTSQVLGDSDDTADLASTGVYLVFRMLVGAAIMVSVYHLLKRHSESVYRINKR